MLLSLASHPKQKGRGNWRSEATPLLSWIVHCRNVDSASHLGEEEEEEEGRCVGELQFECSSQGALL